MYIDYMYLILPTFVIVVLYHNYDEDKAWLLNGTVKTTLANRLCEVTGYNIVNRRPDLAYYRLPSL